jgi:hypothetical protein
MRVMETVHTLCRLSEREFVLRALGADPTDLSLAATCTPARRQAICKVRYAMFMSSPEARRCSAFSILPKTTVFSIILLALNTKKFSLLRCGLYLRKVRNLGLLTGRSQFATRGRIGPTGTVGAT